MLPDIRIAIGAILAGALLIVAAFGLAATVRMAQHRAALPLETSLAYADPAESGRRPDAMRRLEELRGDAPVDDILFERLTASPAAPIIPGRADTARPAEVEGSAYTGMPEAALPPAIVAPLPADAAPPRPTAVEAIVARLETPATPAPTPTEPLAPEIDTPARPAATAEALTPPAATPADSTVAAMPDVSAETAAIPTIAAAADEPEETEPVVTGTAARVASLPATAEAVTKVGARAVPSIRVPARKAAKVRKKSVWARKVARVRAARIRAWIRPTAKTGYPVSTEWPRDWPRYDNKLSDN